MQFQHINRHSYFKTQYTTISFKFFHFFSHLRTVFVFAHNSHSLRKWLASFVCKQIAKRSWLLTFRFKMIKINHLTIKTCRFWIRKIIFMLISTWMSLIRMSSVSLTMHKLTFCATQTSSQTMCLALNQTIDLQ
jgi:hypothetical protein